MKKSIIILLLLSSLSACSQDKNAEVYEVTQKDNQGYYHASQLIQAEDGSLVTVSFYGSKEEVVFTNEEVQGSPIQIGNKVMIDLDENGENPLVENY
jgi:hypothetical protein